MNTNSLRHNIAFIEAAKPVEHPFNHHLLAIDTHAMPAELFQDLQEALLDIGVRYHLQAVRHTQLLCFDRGAFDLLQSQACMMTVPANMPRYAVAAE